jgi:DNA repair protein RadA/Sms
LLTAVLEKKQGLALSDQDIYVNVAGGASLDEPAGDLAVASAILSSFRDVPVDAATVVLGEVGLSGEVRAVAQIEQRFGEAAQLGFRRCVLPEGNARRVKVAPLELRPVGTLAAAMEALMR